MFRYLGKRAILHLDLTLPDSLKGNYAVKGIDFDNCTKIPVQVNRHFLMSFFQMRVAYCLYNFFQGSRVHFAQKEIEPGDLVKPLITLDQTP